MNRQETAGMLTLLCAAFPTFELSEQTARVWEDTLRNTLPEDAMTAAGNVIRTEHRFPSVAQFIAYCQSAARRRAADKARKDRQLSNDDERPVTREEGLEWIRRVRQTIAEARAQAKVPDVPGMRSVGQTLTETF